MCSRTGPIHAASPYSAQAPTSDPIVAAMIISGRARPPSSRATKPANGSTISDGIGGNRFSNATSRATPTYPSASMTSVTHSARLDSIGRAYGRTCTVQSTARFDIRTGRNRWAIELAIHAAPPASSGTATRMPAAVSHGNAATSPSMAR